MNTQDSASPIVKLLARKRTTFTWLVPIALFVADYLCGRANLRLFSLGIGLLVLGELMRFWAAGTIHKDNTVATSGPYGYVRNPLYFGSLLMAVGYCFISGLSWPYWAVVIVLFAIFHLAAIHYEETFLKSKFGEPYLVYLKHVPRLLPRPIPYRTGGADAATFSWQQVLFNREPTTALLTGLSAIAFGIMQYFHMAHH